MAWRAPKDAGLNGVASAGELRGSLFYDCFAFLFCSIEQSGKLSEATDIDSVDDAESCIRRPRTSYGIVEHPVGGWRRIDRD